MHRNRGRHRFAHSAAGPLQPSPVTAVGQQEMKLEGTTDVETLLNNLPAVFADQNSGVLQRFDRYGDRRPSRPRRGAHPGARERHPPDAGRPEGPGRRLEHIPAALVDHVEVLTGGASAVYGSDALAGVVNFVMRKDFEGIEVDGQYGIDKPTTPTPPIAA